MRDTESPEPGPERPTSNRARHRALGVSLVLALHGCDANTPDAPLPHPDIPPTLSDCRTDNLVCPTPQPSVPQPSARPPGTATSSGQSAASASGPGAASAAPSQTNAPSGTASSAASAPAGSATAPTVAPTTAVSASGSASPPPGPATEFPFNVEGSYCTFPSLYNNAEVKAAYDTWKSTVVSSDGAGGFRRVRKPDSGTVVGSTVSEGIGYGMLLAVYMNDPALFDDLWQYEQLHTNANGLMNWEIDPDGKVIGSGGATDGDEDIAWALIMADRLWGGKGTLQDTYLNYAVELINAIWEHEIDHSRSEMVKAGDEWGDVDVTNPSYFAPAYYRVFGEVTGKQSDWNKVVDSSYRIIENSLNAESGNASNGLVPAWCNSAGKPVDGGAGLPLHFQNDSTRTPFRVGQDYCYFGEPRAKAYLEKITSFYKGVGIANIVDGYELDGRPRPEKAMNGLTPASFVGPATVGAMYDASNQAFIDEGYAALATQKLTAGTIYYQKSWTALSLLMLSGNFFEVAK